MNSVADIDSFHQEVRRLEALARLEIKHQQGNSQTQPIKIRTHPLPTPAPKKPRRETTRVAFTRPPAPKQGRVMSTCEICGAPFYKKRNETKYTCCKPECTSMKRSLSQRKADRWFKPKVCEHPLCCNFLDPCRDRAQQKRFCSVQHAAQCRKKK